MLAVHPLFNLITQTTLLITSPQSPSTIYTVSALVDVNTVAILLIVYHHPPSYHPFLKSKNTIATNLPEAICRGDMRWKGR